MSFHFFSLQRILTFLLFLTFHIPSSAESATTHAKNLPPTLNATNTQTHCTNAPAWTTGRGVSLQAADCREATEEFNREGDKQRAEGASWAAPYWANPKAFSQPLGYPTVWTPVRFAAGTWWQSFPTVNGPDNGKCYYVRRQILTNCKFIRLLRVGGCIDGSSGRDTREACSALRTKGPGVLGRTVPTCASAMV